MDTLRLLLEVERTPDKRTDVEIAGVPWVLDPMPSLGLLGVEGNPVGGALWGPEDVLEVGAAVQSVVSGTFGLRRDRGVSRCDLTTSRVYNPAEGRCVIGGMAALELPRMEATRRGTPVHSVWWTGARSAAIKARVYDEAFKVDTREAFERVRFEDQRRYPNGNRPPLEVAADPHQQRRTFLRRFEPMRKAVDGVTAASFPVVAQALADEARYGYRSWAEAERLAGSLVLLGGGAGSAYTRETFYRRKRALREAGYVVVDDYLEPVAVNLGDELEAALDGFGG